MTTTYSFLFLTIIFKLYNQIQCVINVYFITLSRFTVGEPLALSSLLHLISYPGFNFAVRLFIPRSGQCEVECVLALSPFPPLALCFLVPISLPWEVVGNMHPTKPMDSRVGHNFLLHFVLPSCCPTPGRDISCMICNRQCCMECG